MFTHENNYQAMERIFSDCFIAFLVEKGSRKVRVIRMFKLLSVLLLFWVVVFLWFLLKRYGEVYFVKKAGKIKKRGVILGLGILLVILLALQIGIFLYLTKSELEWEIPVYLAIWWSAVILNLAAGIYFVRYFKKRLPEKSHIGIYAGNLCLAVVLLFLTGWSTWKYQTIEKLDNPILLNHCYELALYEEGAAFELSYLANRSDTAKPLSVELPELTEAGGLVKSFSETSREDRGDFSLRTIQVWVQTEELPEETELQLEHAQIQMDDDTVVEGEIGEILLFPAVETAGTEQLVASSMSHSSTSGSAAGDVQLLDTVTLTGVPLSLEKEVDGILHTCMNPVSGENMVSSYQEMDDGTYTAKVEKLAAPGADSIPIRQAAFSESFEEGDWFMLINSIEIPEQDVRRYSRYSIESRYEAENQAGERETLITRRVDYVPSCTEEAVEFWQTYR